MVDLTSRLQSIPVQMIKGRVRWDEANLDEIAANKPIRKKIFEPKTPYHPMIEEDGYPSPSLDSANRISYAAHAEAIRSALNKVAFSEEHSSQFEGWASSDAVEKDEGSIKERQAVNFDEHRRAHYDEFKRVKELQEKTSFLDFEDNYTDEEGGYNSCPSRRSGVREIYIDSGDDILKTINIQGA